MAYRAFSAARIAKNFVPSRALRSSILVQRPAIAAYHNARSNPPLSIPSDDNRNIVKTGWPQDGMELGEYPNLPLISSQRRQFFGWWDQQDRRNYGEPIPEDEDAINVWVWQEVECNDRYTRSEVLSHFLIMFGALGLIYYMSYLYDAPSQNPAVPREFPYDNLYLERGGDPEKDPSEDKRTVPNTLFGM